jgi:signal peptidase I
MNLKTRIAIYTVALTAAACYAASPYRMGFVVGKSMSPALSSGEFYVMKRLSSPLRRGDVVVFQQDDQTLVKRVLGLPGDRFYVQPRIPGTPVEQLISEAEVPVYRRYERRHGRNRAYRIVPRTIPAGYCYVVGDQLLQSEDSRRFGFLDLSAIRGRLIHTPPPNPVLARLAWIQPRG